MNGKHQEEYKPGAADHPVKILKYCTIAMVVLFAAGLAVLFLGSAVYGIVLMSAGICCDVLAITVFWRCPRCDEQLPAKVIFGEKVCPYCGGKLD